MKSRDDWYDGVVKKIGELGSTLSERDYKKYKLDLLLCVAQRIGEFSNECPQCQAFRQDITALAQDAGNVVQIADRESRKAYFKAINSIIGHLQRQHKLVTEGYYIGICMAVGSGLGMALGAAMDNVGSGIPIGVGIGVAVGVALDAKAKKEGRILCPREATRSSKTVFVLLGLLGLLVLGGILAFILFTRRT